jgi:hypothetical protein
MELGTLVTQITIGTVACTYHHASTISVQLDTRNSGYILHDPGRMRVYCATSADLMRLVQCLYPDLQWNLTPDHNL